jgi:Competence protein J (ComJ)
VEAEAALAGVLRSLFFCPCIESALLRSWCGKDDIIAMNSKTILSARFYFSYSQFLVYDASVQVPFCECTAAHFDQGFARRESTVNFRTLLQFGQADLSVNLGPYGADVEYTRVIAVPFVVTSGRVFVKGPEEFEVQRQFEVAPGNYRLTAAQRITVDAEESDGEEGIALFFEPLAGPLERSSILVADDALAVSDQLIETAEIAGQK